VTKKEEEEEPKLDTKAHNVIQVETMTESAISTGSFVFLLAYLTIYFFIYLIICLFAC
jgi:hypothetical protein